MLHFNNDYMRGAHPEVMRMLMKTNMEQCDGYGLDVHTAEAKRLILKECALDSGDVFLLGGGTQTNAVMIDAFLRPSEGVMCVDQGHINVHEAGAIEARGHKVIPFYREDGKLKADVLNEYLSEFYADATWPHMVRPSMVYITQPTELGTLYSRDELNQLKDVCTRYNLPLYADGARLIYALEAKNNDVSLKDLACLCDAFYIGGTKAGLLFGEAVVIPKQGRFPHLFSLIKNHGALMAKGRVTGIQFETLFSNGLYRQIGRHACNQAMRIREAFIGKGWKPLADSTTNQQIFTIPETNLRKIEKVATFDVWGARGIECSTVRFTTDWSTSPEDVDQLLDAIRQ